MGSIDFEVGTLNTFFYKIDITYDCPQFVHVCQLFTDLKSVEN